MGQGCSPEPRDQKTSPDCAWLRLPLGTDVGETCNHGWLEQGFFLCACVVGKWIGLAAQYLWAWFLVCAKLGLVDQSD